MPRYFLLTVFSSLAMCLAGTASATPDADALAQRIADRQANEGRVGKMHFKLVNASGKTRERSALMIHSDVEEATKIAIFFTSPSAIADTGFLSHDMHNKADRNWLYLPATERVRRMPASDRGDYFLGTDLTYGDIKDDFKFQLEDWQFQSTGVIRLDDAEMLTLSGHVKDKAIARETGYSAFQAIIDPTTLFPVKVEYFDSDGEPLKKIDVSKQELVGDAWTATEFTIQHLQTGHTTYVRLTDMRFVPDLDQDLLESDALSDGVPELD